MDDTVNSLTFYVPFLAGKEKVIKKRGLCWRRIRQILVFGICLSLCVGVALLLLPDRTFDQENVHSRESAASLVETRRTFKDVWAETNVVEAFNRFAVAYGKTYQTDYERQRRMDIFQRNLQFIQIHNGMGNCSYTLAVNAFADLTVDEFRQYSASLRPKPRNIFPTKRFVDFSLLKAEASQLPPSVDWRQQGCVTEVKDQRQCGSCWAFSTTGAIEGAVCVKTGKLRNLSEQQLVDCAGPEGNLACHGGEADWGFQYVIDNGGLCSEDDYPYNAAPSDYCKARECRSVGRITRFHDVPPHSGHALRAAIARHGPVSVAVEADQATFQFYKDGVFNGHCGTQLDHAVLLVGYGKDAVTGEEFFILKNSWGSSWGEDGYMRISANARRSHEQSDGECGLFLAPSYAAV